MKQYKKKEILETADLLIEANRYITGNYRTGSRERIVEILTQCQEMAILLGNCLEAVGDSGKELVPALEDYCEKIYQFSQSLTDEIACRKIAKQTTRQLANLKVNIIDQIPGDKIEIVFLPYKAAMWDSLESVWRAADEDPECNAYVVPIPYFERDAQGQLAVMHYEGDQFPEDVPVIHYLDYNMAERRPDVVFIHNPYDKNNHVTSIHPAYYVPELKKYAKKVAYIPYYVSAEPNPDSPEAQKQKKGFVLQPGVIESDLVFVQSEDMKKLYVNILEKEIPNVGRKYWEDKIFGLGSPKLDRVRSTKRNDELLSSEWHSLIYDSKGNRKRVIFYNTSLHDLLNQKNMMEKIADTLAFFKGRDDCVLWWRPHPLYESTLASMLPGLLPVYRKIVEDYIAEEWGIFDEGEDLDWVIAETDAYYGDRSSVVQLYKEAGKPVLYQDTRVKNSVDEEVEIPIWPYTFCVDGDDIWFVHGKMNLLMKYSISQCHTSVLGVIPNKNMFYERLFIGICKYNNYVYLIPSGEKCILIYDADTQIFEKIDIDNVENFENKALFSKIYTKGKELYCIPCYYNAILKIDMESKQVKYLLIQGGKAYINDSTIVGDYIVAVYVYTNEILFCNIMNDTILLKRLGNKNRKYTNITNFQDKLYLYDQDTFSIIKMEGDNYEIEKNFCKIECNGIRMTSVLSDLIIIDPADRAELQVLDANKKMIFRSEKLDDFATSSLGSPYCNGVQSSNIKNNEHEFYFSRASYSMYQFGKGEEIKTFKMKLEKEELNKVLKHISMIEQQELGENDVNKLEVWMEKLQEKLKKKDSLKQACDKSILYRAKISAVNK
jgi:hypothetical protein